MVRVAPAGQLPSVTLTHDSVTVAEEIVPVPSDPETVPDNPPSTLIVMSCALAPEPTSKATIVVDCKPFAQKVRL